MIAIIPCYPPISPQRQPKDRISRIRASSSSKYRPPPMLLKRSSRDGSSSRHLGESRAVRTPPKYTACEKEGQWFDVAHHPPSLSTIFTHLTNSAHSTRYACSGRKDAHSMVRPGSPITSSGRKDAHSMVRPGSPITSSGRKDARSMVRPGSPITSSGRKDARPSAGWHTKNGIFREHRGQPIRLAMLAQGLRWFESFLW
jgi:hypothetical protein